MDEDSSMEQKTWQGYNFGEKKEMFLGYILMSPERDSVGAEGKGHSM